VFVFASSGIVACTLNDPESWHVSCIAENRKLYEKLKSFFDSTGGITVVDLAFFNKRCPFMIKSGKKKNGETMMQSTICIKATSLRQSAEWGMRASQGRFPRLYDRLLFSESIEHHKVFLHLIAMLLNFWNRQVGLNQLSSTFYPMFQEAGDDALDNIMN
jgi:hypothetical protein